MGNPAPAPSSGASFFTHRRLIRRIIGHASGGGARMAWVVAGMAILGGCSGHRDAVDTLTDWYHTHQGGVIGQQRPPPPGAHDPYPHIGLGPKDPPVLPSQDLRDDITTNLEAQRNLIHRQDATMGPIPSVADVPPPPVTDTRAGGAQSASFAAATPAPQKATAPAAGTTGIGATDAPIAMPEVTSALPTDEQVLPKNLPALAAAPPAPVVLDGVGAMGGNDVISRPLPDYRLAEDQGKAVRFEAGSDQMQPGQDRTISNLVSTRGDSDIAVNGYGDATSASAGGQAQAMSLAILRGRTIARALVAQGVPVSAIHLHASAFGTGARIGIVR
ncbi:OmpA family protein [Novacetimonas pomaceti]|uniref:OmpA family protein n=1 Tax=Novacetimonas pomaceti TaxID=2021998 RepID=UPI001402609A|nr:OmpA family protein [Novacetimonas pomaceti]